MHERITYIFGNSKTLSKYSGFTYGLAEGLSPCWCCSTASLSKPKPLDGGILPLLGDRPSPPSKAALFLLLGGGILGSLSPLSLGEEVGGGVSLSIISRTRSPKKRFAQKNSVPKCKITQARYVTLR